MSRTLFLIIILFLVSSIARASESSELDIESNTSDSNFNGYHSISGYSGGDEERVKRHICNSGNSYKNHLRRKRRKVKDISSESESQSETDTIDITADTTSIEITADPSPTNNPTTNHPTINHPTTNHSATTVQDILTYLVEIIVLLYIIYCIYYLTLLKDIYKDPPEIIDDQNQNQNQSTSSGEESAEIENFIE